MAFDLDQWKASIQHLVDNIVADPERALQRAGTTSLYTLLLGSTMLPVINAYAVDPATTMSALIGLAGGLGANLAANLIQRKYDDQQPTAIVIQEAQDPILAPAYELLAREIGVFAIAAEALTKAGQLTVLDQLRAELSHFGKLNLLPSNNVAAHQAGTGNAIGGISSGSTGPTVSGSVSSGRDTNIATSLTITNVGADKPSS
ncbi:MAG: hypothetical protein HC828_07385 [Blastochloris sp.]|nr:hypothetical protein [Blastochloris sp.]